MTSKSGGLSPPILSDAEKFDGSNYLEWRETILMACRVRGARGYLEGRIMNPAENVSPSTSPQSTVTSSTTSTTTPTTIPLSPVDTPWTSLFPSAEEWDARDAWCLLAICQNVKNAVGLGLKTNGTAAEAWKSLEDRYNLSSDLARVYAQRELRAVIMTDGEDFRTHLSTLHIKHKRANAVGANVTDSDFREIILASLPSSWDNIIATLHQTPSLMDTIVSLELHWSRVNRNTKVRTAGTTAVALKANARNDTFNKKVCVNANCRRRGHLIEDCYWKGGGKEGQFPPGFGQRGGATGSAANAAGATGGTTQPAPTANVAVVETAYALCAMYNLPEPEYADNPGPPCDLSEYTISRIPDNPDADRDELDEVAMVARSGETIDRATYADSGATRASR
ncbi:hypothetical protein CVT25_000136 [Psilocybe cyanescens]|uniref:Retrotransposon Copia-like N-terminal domain-containing protein n=1 Tax=Psilocybe cyanescens TaxID=93625 RepID=A0A409W1T2_PSICY|nr:hypothetical protein CVT25_000136 [Psilocybe cyanescens]